MKKIVLNGYVYNFSVDYNDTVVDDILDIGKYLTKKMIQYKMLKNGLKWVCKSNICFSNDVFWL